MAKSVQVLPIESQATSEAQLKVTRWACLGILVMVMIGLWAQWPYLLIEHGRLEPWKSLELWCANILALVWFGRFALEHAVLGEPLLPVPFGDARKQIRIICIAGVTAILLELFFTLALVLDEHAS